MVQNPHDEFNNSCLDSHGVMNVDFLTCFEGFVHM